MKDIESGVVLTCGSYIHAGSILICSETIAHLTDGTAYQLPPHLAVALYFSIPPCGHFPPPLSGFSGRDFVRLSIHSLIYSFRYLLIAYALESNDCCIVRFCIRHCFSLYLSRYGSSTRLLSLVSQASLVVPTIQTKR